MQRRHPMAGGTAYAVNNKAHGKVHRVTAATARLPHHKQRVACGWPILRSTSIVYYSRRLKFCTRFCLKCFPPVAHREEAVTPTTGAGTKEQNMEDDIEQFACEAAPG